MAPKERDSWGSHCEFLLTSLGLAVGLGNVWRFPYITYMNGGGTFLIPYFICLLFIAWPLLFQEMAVGQCGRVGCNKAFVHMAPISKGMAWAIFYTRVSAQVYFMVITSWAIYFLFAGFTSELPWDTCTEEWNTRDCYSLTFNEACSESQIYYNFSCSTKENYCLSHGYQEWDEATDSCTAQGQEDATVEQVLAAYSVSPAEDYFEGKVLGLTKDEDGTQYSWTDYGAPQWELVLCQLLGWIVVSVVAIKGLRSLGKAAYVLTLMPYVLLTVLLGYSVTLPGAADGIEFFMSPDWELLGDTDIWLQASVQIVTSTAVACGSHMALASFNRRTNNVLVDSVVIATLNSLTSIYAGFVVFSMTGFLAHETQTSVDNVVEGGITLAFVTYPSAFLEMVVPPLWNFFFFLTLISLAMSGLTASNQVVASFITDEWPQLQSHERKVLLAIPVFCFLCGLPFTCNGGIHLFTLQDQRGTVSLLAIAVLQDILVSWVYGMNSFYSDLESMNMRQPRWARWLWNAVFLLLIPAALTYMYAYSLIDMVPVAYGSYVYEDSVQAVGVFLLVVPLLFVVMYAIWFVAKTKYSGASWTRVLKISFATTEGWTSVADSEYGDKAAIAKKEEE